ncbi:DNA-3-methyladenine glycosylase family protein [Bauldia sp.]|uniref:DNA-3-methyladenine glycosylase family protein n=1 Tax=Bauldia sp. TaxID=2575872 RepID=UPI003BAA55AC
MRTITTDADVAEGLAFLARRDRRLKEVIDTAGPVPLRRTAAGFEGLARIVVAQQLSVASAAAIWGRVQSLLPNCDATAVLATSEAHLRGAGLSAAKIRTLQAIAETAVQGFDFNRLAELPGDEAHATLTEIRGIGPWTADIYLLFCLGHADIFPAGDIALRNAVADAFGHDDPIPIDDLHVMAEMWSPWRGVAARLFWAYYRVMRQRAAVPV